MGKKIVQMEVDDRTIGYVESWNKELIRFANEMADSQDLINILSNAMLFLYQTQPGGKDNYGGENPLVGKVGLSRDKEAPGTARIDYEPSADYEKMFGYVLTVIGTIDLRERTYSVPWDKRYEGHGDFYKIPEILMRDTERVMECVGLTRSKEKPEMEETIQRFQPAR